MSDASANPIGAARAKLGWSVERLAATMVMTPQAVEEMEAAPLTFPPIGAQLAAFRCFAARGVEFVTGDAHGVIEIVGPCDEKSLAKIDIGERAIAVLKELESLRPIGARINEIGNLGDLRKNDLVQLANCKFVAMFDDGEVAETQPYFHIRLSKRGRALLAYLATRPKSNIIRVA